MKVCLDIEFDQKIVCILGGGKVAYRKAKQFCCAFAQVYVSSLVFIDAFEELDVHMVSYQELVAMLKEATLAIACTDDVQANRRFLEEAHKYHVLTMASQKNVSQDTFSVSSIRKDHVLLACNTNGGFPLANHWMLEQMNRRIELLATIRHYLQDPSLRQALMTLDDEQLLFLQKVVDQKGVVYLLHGSNDFLAKRQCDHLVSLVENASYFFLAKKCLRMDLDTYCQILKALGADVKFYFLFWDIHSFYVEKAITVLESRHFSYKYIELDPHSLLKKDEKLILHTKENSEGVVVTMVYSSYMKKKHSHNKYLCALDQAHIVERIVNETN